MVIQGKEPQQLFEEALNLSNEKRENYYEYYLEPNKPGWGEKTNEYIRYQKTPKFIGFTLKRAWTFFLNFVIFMILVAIGQCSGLGVKDIVTTDSIDQRVEEKVKKSDEKHNYTYKPEELKEKREEFTLDSIKYAEKYKELKENPDMKKIISFKNDEDGTTQHYFVKMTLWGLISILVIFSPLIIWLIVTIVKLTIEINKYKDAKRYNRRLDDNYKYAMECYNTNPTCEQMEVFIEDFLMRYVDSELKFHRKFEEDFKGVTLFTNRYYDFEEEDENGNEDTYVDSYVKLTTVLLEDDCVTVMKSNWHVYEDAQSVGIFEQISYGDIGSVVLTADELTFGGISIEIPESQIFEYQNSNPSDKTTYSTTRTSDVRTFAVALRKLVQDYKNR